MAGAKETPRQKMIGMMYLVLTALLALQVSSAIIEKFDFMNKSMEKSTAEATSANGLRLKAIQEVVQKENIAKNVPLLKQAEDVKKETSETMTYLEDLKKQLIETSGGPGTEGESYKNPSAETEVEAFMIGGAKNGKAYELKQKLDKTVQYLSQISGENFQMLAQDASEIPGISPAQKKKDFAEFNFGQTPMVAALATISQKQNEIARYEAAVLEKIANKVNASPVAKFDQIVAMVRPESRVVAAGTKYKAEMFIAASSSGVSPTMAYNGQSIPVVAGRGNVEFTATGGAYDKDGNVKKTWEGTITIPKSDGGDTTFPVKTEYIVAKPVIQVQSASVQALYASCGNELKVGVPALGATYQPSFGGSGASFIQGANKGDVTVVPTSLNDVTLSVSSGGNLIGSEKFKVRPVPRPEVKAFSNTKELDAKNGSAAPYPSSIEVRALAEEGFRNFLPKDAQFRVNSFDVFLVRGGRATAPVSSNGSKANIGGIVSQARPGDQLLIEIKGVQRMNFKGQVIESAPAGSKYISIPLK